MKWRRALIGAAFILVGIAATIPAMAWLLDAPMPQWCSFSLHMDGPSIRFEGDLVELVLYDYRPGFASLRGIDPWKLRAGIRRDIGWLDIGVWPLALLGMLPGLVGVRLLWRSRSRPGLCPACGYSRAGLAAGAVCPECGTGRASASGRS